MSVFDVLREKFNERHTFYENRFSEMGGTDRDVEDWGSIKSYADAIEIVNQVEQFCKETLNLNVDDKKPTATELVEHLHMHMELFTFDPFTGNDLEPYQMNELNRDLYSTMYYAKEFLESTPKTNADRIRSMSDEELAEFIANDCLEIADDICGSYPQETTENCGSGCCVEHIVSWLKKEVK